jgi:alpha-beta hydrolase superfamily lysophospholipase
MSLQIKTLQIPFQDITTTKNTNALAFIPSAEKFKKNRAALFTHGFTSHKASIFNWPLRLAEEGIPCVLFDLPGHFLGTFCEVDDFQAFKQNAPKMFCAALDQLSNLTPQNPIENLVLGGHSLGALIALKAIALNEFKNIPQKTAIAVGFGMPPEGVTHIFKTPFYKSTLMIRAQLVSKALNPDIVFPWIKEEKEALSLSNQKIYFLTGEDDMVVGKDGTQRLAQKMTEQGNRVILEMPSKLPHHLPEGAAPHIKKFLKDQGFFLS